jgi:hypothetical protein
MGTAASDSCIGPWEELRGELRGSLDDAQSRSSICDALPLTLGWPTRADVDIWKVIWLSSNLAVSAPK